MGIYGQGGYNYKILEWLYNPSYDGSHNWGANGYEATRLFRRLMEDVDFSREFIDHCAVYMGDFLNETGIRAVWDPMYEQIKYEYPNHRKLVNQWWPNYNEELNAARSWVKQRTASFYTQLADYYKLGTPVAMLINQSGNEEQRARITFNGIPLSEGVFDGKFFADRAFTLEATPSEGMMVSGWKVQQISSNGAMTTREVQGPELSMTMPQGYRLVINPIQIDATGIDAIATTAAEQPPTVYTLSGQRIDKPKKGINIINGRKVLVK